MNKKEIIEDKIIRNKKTLIIIIISLIFISLLAILFIILGNKNTKLASWSKKYNSYEVIDRTEICAEALELIYSDDNYEYYLACIKSETIFIKYDNGWEETLKVALSEEHISIDSLLNKNINIIKVQLIEENEGENIASCNTNDFEMSIFSDKKIYKTNEKIKIWATFKYVGDEEKIKIWHASEYIIFSITDGKDFNSEGVVNSILLSSILEKDKLYYFEYQKSGGFDASGPDAKFWENFYKEKDLLLPAGDYTIKLNGAFSYSSDMGDNVDLICLLKIKVEK